jgi:Zinc finger, ZZ type/PB1 domain
MYIKIKHHDNIIKQKYENQSLQDLISIVKNKCNPSKPFKLAYLDVEQDHITISTDEDLKLGIEELRETTAASGATGQVPALTIIVVEEGEIASMPNDFSDILPKEALFASGPDANPTQMLTEPINVQPQAAEKKAQVNEGLNYPAPAVLENQQPAVTKPEGGLFSNAPRAEQQRQSSLFSNEQRPSQGQSSLFSNVPLQDATAASRGGLFSAVAPNNQQPTTTLHVAQAQQQSTSLFQPAQPQQQQPQTGKGLFSNATPASNTSNLFSNQGTQPVYSNGLFNAIPQFAQPIAYVGPAFHQQVNYCRRPAPNSTQHRGVQCDHCRVTPIVGRRYKSVQRLNFDLCGNCINQPQYRHEKFLMLQTHNPNDPSLTQASFSTVVNHFNSGVYYGHPVFPNPLPSPVFVQPIYPGGYHVLFTQLKSAFQNDSDQQINNFLFQGGYSAYTPAYNDYVRRFHLSKH